MREVAQSNILDTNIYIANFRSGAYQKLIDAPSDYLSTIVLNELYIGATQSQLKINFPHHTYEYDYNAQQIRTFETEKISYCSAEKWTKQYAAAQYSFVKTAFSAFVNLTMKAIIDTTKVSHPRGCSDGAKCQYPQRNIRYNPNNEETDNSNELEK